MKHIYLPLLLLILLLFSCSKQKEELIINGTVSQEKDFNNEWLYLHPMYGDSLAVLDSAQIAGNQFVFTVPADKPSIRAIRTKNPMLQYYLQPLLVVIEPGVLTVQINRISSGAGAPLNDELQEWKEHKMQSDSILLDLQRKYRNTEDEAGKAQIKAERELLMEENREYNRKFADENKDNVLGEFLGTVI